MPDIRHSLLIASSPDFIYHAITTSEGLSAWWTPQAKATPELNTIATFPFADGYVKKMRIEQLVPNQLVRWTCLEGDKEWLGTHLSFELHASSNDALLESHPEITGQVEQNNTDRATMLVFQHNGWRDYTPTFAECSYTWAIFLRSLKSYCETGAGTPWPTQHVVG